MKYRLKARDTFEFGSESFIVGEYDDVEKAKKSKERREKNKEAKRGNTFYQYFIEDSKGNRVYT